MAMGNRLATMANIKFENILNDVTLTSPTIEIENQKDA